MTDMFLAEIIGFVSMGVIISIGIGLSGWKGEFDKNHNPCNKNCCNPDHWNKEDRDKLSPEQYKTMKKNVARGKIIE